MTATSTERPTPAPTAAPVARLRDVHIGFGPGRDAEVVRGIDLDLTAGRVTALVGESGSGKTLTSLALLGLLPAGATVTSGTVEFDGVDTATLDDAGWRRLRGPRIAMVFQDPMAALNPSFTVGWQIAETFRRHENASKKDARRRAVSLMETVGIADADRRFDAYPHEFSGGMRQRAVIAMALALEPDVLLADEPTTALDVTVQAQILRLLAASQVDAQMAMLLVSHDLGVVARIAQDVAVMYAGRIVETGPLDDVYDDPSHPYTLGLLGAIPDPGRHGRLRPIEGQPAPPGKRPPGCAFADRCPFVTDVCRTTDPILTTVDRQVGHTSACHHIGRVRRQASERR